MKLTKQKATEIARDLMRKHGVEDVEIRIESLNGPKAVNRFLSEGDMNSAIAAAKSGIRGVFDCDREIITVDPERLKSKKVFKATLLHEIGHALAWRRLYKQYKKETQHGRMALHLTPETFEFIKTGGHTDFWREICTKELKIKV